MIICVCKRVSDQDVEEAVDNGARSAADVQDMTGAGSDCGCCSSLIEAHVSRACQGRSSGACAGCPETLAATG